MMPLAGMDRAFTGDRELRTPYNAEELAAFKERLLNLARGIDEQMAVYNGSSKPVSLDEPIGRLTRSDAMQEQQMFVHLRERLAPMPETPACAPCLERRR